MATVQGLREKKASAAVVGSRGKRRPGGWLCLRCARRADRINKLAVRPVEESGGGRIMVVRLFCDGSDYDVMG